MDADAATRAAGGAPPSSPSRLTVLLVSQELPPDTGWGGIGTYVDILAPALVAAGADVHVLSVVPGQRRSSVTTAGGVRVHRAPLVRPPGIGRLTRMPESWHRLSLAWAVARELSRLRSEGVNPDVVEAPEWNAEALFVVRQRRWPVVIRTHAAAAQVFPFVQGGTASTDRRLAVRLEGAALRRADVVIGTRSQLQDVGGRIGLGAVETRAIPCPVRLAEVVPPPEHSSTICFAGRFERRKNPEVLIRAMPAVRAAVSDARLVLVGRDSTGAGQSYASMLHRLAAELDVEDAVDFVVGWHTPDAVARRLAAAAVCAVPSRWESFGYVAAEAAALGRPVVAANVPGLAEVVIDGVTGRLAPPEDPRAWARTLTELLLNPAGAAALGRRGASHVADAFAPQRVAAMTLDAYRAAIRRHGARQRVAA